MIGNPREHREMSEPRNLELEDVLREHRDDPALYRVPGDWLKQCGHPRGRLIAVQAALAEPPARVCSRARTGRTGPDSPSPRRGRAPSRRASTSNSPPARWCSRPRSPRRVVARASPSSRRSGRPERSRTRRRRSFRRARSRSSRCRATRSRRSSSRASSSSSRGSPATSCGT